MKLFYCAFLAFTALLAVGCSDSISTPTNRLMSDVEADMRLNSRAESGVRCYPISIDCDEWRNMDSHAQKVAFLELPDSLYQSMSSEELALLCMTYPLNIDAYAYDDLASGLERVMSYAGCYQELLRRSDCATGIISAIKACDPAVYLQSSASKVDKYSMLIDCNLLMQMLQLPQITATLPSEEAKEAISYLYYLAEVETQVLTDDNYTILAPLTACEACLQPGIDLRDSRAAFSPAETSAAIFDRLRSKNITPYNN